MPNLSIAYIIPLDFRVFFQVFWDSIVGGDVSRIHALPWAR